MHLKETFNSNTVTVTIEVTLEVMNKESECHQEYHE